MSLPVSRRVVTRARGATTPPRTAPISAINDELTPVKDTLMYNSSRTDIEASKNCQDIFIDNNFLSNHLRQPPPSSAWLKRASKPFIEQIKKAGSNSNVIYIPLSRLLSEYSERVHDKLTKRATKRKHPYYFLDFHSSIPLFHPFKDISRPDLIVVEGKPRGRVPYYTVVSVLECKPVKKDGQAQLASYMSLHMDARPDMPGVYGLWVRPDGYQVLWSDASGVIASPKSSWDVCELLAAYVYSLYYPPADHILFDQTTTSPSAPRLGSDKTRWTIKGHLKDPYPACEWIFTASSWGRRTNVWKHEIKGKGPVVVKDAYRDNKRNYEEEILIKKIHSNGIFPGVVRILEPAEHYQEITTPPTHKAQRTKTRLIMGSYGESLLQAKSVKDLLMAVYDIVEIHRKLVMDSQILHRDISLNNIMMYPRHHSDALNGKVLISEPPVFIKDVLGEKDEINAPDNSMGLLIDFDNGADLSTAGIAKKELVLRTGTPRFIARSVAAGTVRKFVRHFTPMPTLGENARKYYIDAYGHVAYDRYRNDNGVDTIHGSKYTHSMVVQRKFVHRPDHDVESIFWVLYLVLLTVRPAVPSEDWDDDFNKQALGYIENHVIVVGSQVDSRDPLLTNNDLVLCASLEPKLAFLGPMLNEMGCHIAPEYAYVDEEPPKDHLHEVMRRLLLRYILEMKDPIPLDANVALSPKTPATGGSGAGRGGSKKAMSILEEQRMSMRRLSVVEKGSKASRVDSQPEDTSQEAGGSRSNNGGSKRGGKSQSNTRIPQRGRKATQTKRRG